MRHLVTTLLMVTGLQLAAQITLEHTYEATGRFYGYSQLLMIELEASGLKYVSIDQVNKEINFYHMDHTLYKTISMATAPYPSGWVPGSFTPDIMYISEHLFDMDDDIEFMFVWNLGTSGSTTILDEDGTFLLSAPQEMPLIRGTIPTQQWPIYNTPFGTKMILSTVDSTARVYHLPGELTVAMRPIDQELLNSADVRIYPNPGFAEINLDLGKTAMSYSHLVVYDALGGRSQSVTLNGQNFLTLPIDHLASGQYYVVLSRSGGGLMPCGSFIKE